MVRLAGAASPKSHPSLAYLPGIPPGMPFGIPPGTPPGIPFGMPPSIRCMFCVCTTQKDHRHQKNFFAYAELRRGDVTIFGTARRLENVLSPSLGAVKLPGEHSATLPWRCKTNRLVFR